MADAVPTPLRRDDKLGDEVAMGALDDTYGGDYTDGGESGFVVPAVLDVQETKQLGPTDEEARQLAAHGKKSYKRKYAKEKIKYELRVRECNELFQEEAQIRKLAKRLREQNDQLLEMLADLNETAHLDQWQRYNLDLPANQGPALDELYRLPDSGDRQLPPGLNPSERSHAEDTLRRCKEQLHAGAITPATCREIERDILTGDLYRPRRYFALLREQIRQRLPGFPAARERLTLAAQDPNDISKSFGYLAAMQEGTYLAELDQKAGCEDEREDESHRVGDASLSVSEGDKDIKRVPGKLEEAEVDAEDGAATATAGTTVTTLSATSSKALAADLAREREEAIRNPMSVFNWFRRDPNWSGLSLINKEGRKQLDEEAECGLPLPGAAALTRESATDRAREDQEAPHERGPASRLRDRVRDRERARPRERYRERDIDREDDKDVGLPASTPLAAVRTPYSRESKSRASLQTAALVRQFEEFDDDPDYYIDDGHVGEVGDSGHGHERSNYGNNSVSAHSTSTRGGGKRRRDEDAGYRPKGGGGGRPGRRRREEGTGSGKSGRRGGRKSALGVASSVGSVTSAKATEATALRDAPTVSTLNMARGAIDTLEPVTAEAAIAAGRGAESSLRAATMPDLVPAAPMERSIRLEDIARSNDALRDVTMQGLGDT
ncbi:hypothetical protein KEM52_004272 [Ascosphaera acerosa]|nr:hypothetical protein KEM52_004272 [Ascosphaera acerosa]